MAGTADRITIEGHRVSTTSPEGLTVSIDLGQFLAAAFPRRMDSCGIVLPHGTALAYTEGPTTVWVHETPPRTYRFRWIAADSPVPFGPGARYRDVRIALPYLVTLAVFEGTSLSEANECFFRNGPIASEDDPLHYPALLNCSRFDSPEGHPLSWICTQKLDRSTIAGPGPNRLMRSGFRALMHCLLETAFNDSSDHHEASSWYTESRSVDRRISTVECWQEATERDPVFALEVPWLATGKTIHEVVERIFRNHPCGPRRVTSFADLVRLIFNNACRA
jgi:hypothetical protein